jgi:uncharacterized RmlC-like cupin family protein
MTHVMAKYEELVPYQSQHANNGIPREVMEHLAATRVFPVVCPQGLVGRNAMAPLRGWPGLCITIAECTPKDGPVAHDHTGTLETFFCIDGQFEISWGNQLEHKVTLEPGDLCSVPPRMYRTFHNLSDHDGRLLVLIQGDKDMSDKIEMPRAIGLALNEKYGPDVIEKLAAINMRFQGEDEPEFSWSQMQERIARQPKRSTLNSMEPVQETAVMSSPGNQDVAPVTCWPGLDVSILSLGPISQDDQKVGAENRLWVFNLDAGACEVSIEAEPIVLNQLDVICIEPGTSWHARNLSNKPTRLLLARQSKDAISH